MNQSKNNLNLTLLFAIITILTGIIVYIWQHSLLEQYIKNYDSELEKYEQEIAELKRQSEIFRDITFPIVTYAREGLLNNTEGEQEKLQLEEKLIRPITEYHNKNEIYLIALYIVVPQNIGEEYDVIAIYNDHNHDEFGFGARGKDYSYWEPEIEE